MKLSRAIFTSVVIVLIGLLIGAFAYIKSLKGEINQLKQTVTSLNKNLIRLQKERDNYVNQLNKERFALYNGLAKAYKRSRMYEEAILEYQKAIALYPSGEGGDIFYSMGVIYDKHLDQPERAIACYMKYLERSAEDDSKQIEIKESIAKCQKRLEEKE